MVMMPEEKRVIDIGELNPRFPINVMKQPGGEALQKCFQCAVCVASCPIRAIETGYNPRRIIKMTLLGMKDRVLSDNFIWLCSVCFLCQERCPQEVRPPEVMNAIKNLAVKEGIVPPPISKLLDVLRKTGRLYEIDEFVAEERDYMGLPKIAAQSTFVKKILEKK